jgi:hypothetical protein
MKRLAIAILFSLFAPLALANHCPTVMKEIDNKLQTPAAKNIPADKMAKIKALRAEGEKLHKEGKHEESLKALDQANAMLGA